MFNLVGLLHEKNPALIAEDSKKASRVLLALP